MDIKCSKCGISKSLDDFRLDKDFVPHRKCVSCEDEYTRNYNIARGHIPMDLNPKCALYLGVHVAERVLVDEFKELERMPNNNPGYDYICGKGFKIDVKSASGRILAMKNDYLSWVYNIKGNHRADYFLCLAFGSRQDLNPVHLWLIPAKLVNSKMMLTIRGSQEDLTKWSAYERPLDGVIARCDAMRCAE